MCDNPPPHPRLASPRPDSLPPCIIRPCPWPKCSTLSQRGPCPLPHAACHLPRELKTCLSPSISSVVHDQEQDPLSGCSWLHFQCELRRTLQLFNAFNYICWLALNVFIINRINIDTGAANRHQAAGKPRSSPIPNPSPTTNPNPGTSPVPCQLWLIVD